MSQIKEVIKEIKNKYPHLEPEIKLVEREVEWAEEATQKCDYEKLTEETWWLGAFFWRMNLIDIEKEDRLKLFEAEDKFLKEIADKLKTHCGCK